MEVEETFLTSMVELNLMIILITIVVGIAVYVAVYVATGGVEPRQPILAPVVATGGGRDVERTRPPAHMYGSYKELLLGIFEDMDNDEYQRFKQYLQCAASNDNKSIPRWRIMSAERHGMPDLILRYIQRHEALEVVARILRELPNVQLLERIEQFTHPEPGTAGYIVMRVKHRAATQEDYLANCHQIAELLDEFDPGLGNFILDKVGQGECVLVKYLLYIKELALKNPADIIQKMSSEGCKKNLRRLGVIYITVEDATLFAGELHGDPRTWDPVEVTQWVARTLLARDQTATVHDLQMTGAEICDRPETWFTDKFPAGMGRVLYSDLQQRRDDVARQRKFGGRQQELERVVEKTSATFLVSAYLMSMMLTLLGQHRGKAEHILEYLEVLISVIKRRSKNKELVHSRNFDYQVAADYTIKDRRRLYSSAASVVFGSKAIAISSEAYSRVVTSVAEAMEVIGAPLEIKIKLPWWQSALAVGVIAIGAVVVAIAGPLVAVVAGIIAAAAAYGVNQFLVVAFDVLVESEKKTAAFKVNYLQALILLPRIVEEEEMTEAELRRIVRSVKDESEYRTIRDAEWDAVYRAVYRVTPLGPGSIPSTTQSLQYEAKAWLQDDSISNVSDTMIIVHTQFELRRLLRDMFVLGVIGSEHSGKTTLVKSVLPRGEQSAHQTTTCPYDVKLYDGSNELGEDTLPVLAFPSGQRKEVDAAHGLCVGICTAFICVVEYKPGSLDIGAIARMKNLSVPVLLCVNKCGGVKDQREANQILDKYKSKVSRVYGSLQDLTEVVLTDFQTTDRPVWLTGAEDVKYWIKDAIQNHNSYVSNA